MVKNEVPYIVEWIEYNRIQGVDRIIIYDDTSADSTLLLNEFYQQRDPGSHIHAIKSVDRPRNMTGKNMQQMNFQHCLETFGNSTEWMVNLDVDEFLYSPAFGTLAHMLRNLSVIEKEKGLHFSSFTTTNLNFGSSGQQHRFENRLEKGADGRVSYHNPCGLQLITDHVLRGPAANLFGEDEEYQVLCMIPTRGVIAHDHERMHRYARAHIHTLRARTSHGEQTMTCPASQSPQAMTRGLWICGLKGRFPPCRHNPGKTIFRPPDVEVAGIHLPIRYRRHGDVINYDPPLLVGNHYYYRSRADVLLKAKQWRAGRGMPEHVRNYNLTDSLLWGRTKDYRLRDRWGPELLRRMRRLVTTDGPGKCLHGTSRKPT